MTGTQRQNEAHRSRIDEHHYDTTEYFERHVETVSDLDTPFQRYRVAKVLQICTPYSGDRVLDLGCGWGTFSFAVAPLCEHVVGVDFSRKSIDLCNRLLGELKYANVSFICADAQETGLEPGSFDLVICADLLEHLYSDAAERVYGECRRLLKVGGRLSIWTPHRGHILEIMKNSNILLKRDVTHVDYKSMDRVLESLRTRGFLVEKSYYAESHVPVLRTLERLLMPALPFMRRRIAILARKG